MIRVFTCEFCHGTGLRTIYNYDDCGSDADDQPCIDCDGTGTYEDDLTPPDPPRDSRSLLELLEASVRAAERLQKEKRDGR